MTAIIFAGPSLPSPGRPPAPWIEWRPPARRGDLEQALSLGPRAIGIIDGYFETTPTVWHAEILHALRCGIPVYGSASIGALRAAELAPFGMTGVGRIFEAFRNGYLMDDDEVALLHAPPELDYAPLSEAMVNIRATLCRAVRRRCLARRDAEQLRALGKTAFYKERTYERLLHDARRMGIAESTLHAFEGALPTVRRDQKRLDAWAMVVRMHRDLGRGDIAGDSAWAAGETSPMLLSGPDPRGGSTAQP